MKTHREAYFILIGDKLKQLRKAMGYNNAEHFAMAYGLNPSSYYKWEQGETICLTSLIRILDVHEMNIRDFFAQFPQPIIVTQIPQPHA